MPDRPVASCWFAGDLADPWVAEIADALPRPARRLDCPGDLPETWPVGPLPNVVILHRANLTPTDAERLRLLRGRGPCPPRVVLCAGSYARYHHWERWGPLIDAVLPEATASASVARHLIEGEPRSRSTRPRLAVVGGDRELRHALADACDLAGFAPETHDRWADAPSGVVSLAIVPMLADDWAHDLAHLARTRPIVALLGFADRLSVSLAKRRGAVACLDLPCDLADLIYVLDRIVWNRNDLTHHVPPPPLGLRFSRSAVVDPGRPA